MARSRLPSVIASEGSWADYHLLRTACVSIGTPLVDWLPSLHDRPTMTLYAKYPSTHTLVPNAVRHRMHVADAFRAAPGREVVVAPPVAVLSQWVEELVVRMCLMDGEAAPVSVDAFELLQLWERALGERFSYLAKGERMLAARQARSADRLLNYWASEDGSVHLERRFWMARNSVRASLNALQKLQPEDWLVKLITRLQGAGALPCVLPDALRLDGFHELTALELSVLAALEKRGVRMLEEPLRSPAAARLRLCSYPTLDDELAAGAVWAGGQLEAGIRRIAVVVNDLDSQATTVRGVFENLITPDRRLALDELGDAPFHVAAGEPLLAQPVIADALLLLSLSVGGLQRPAEFPQLSRCLLSPYWHGADAERAARAKLEIELRKDGQYWREPIDITRRVKDLPFAGALEKLIESFVAVQSQTSGQHRDKAPAQRLFAILQSWGWPGPLARGDDVMRGVAQFNQLLERLVFMQPESDAAALASLQQLCAESRIELRGGPLSPIQILSPDDAAGRSFDAAWVANMHDGNWPAHPINNPFLPDQAMARIARSTAEGQLAYCQMITQKLSALAPEVCFSWSRHSGEAPNGPSPLLPGGESMVMDAGPPAALSQTFAPEVSRLTGYRAHPWLVAVDDRTGLPLRGKHDDLPAQAIPGGAGMVRDQSGCPLKAYVQHRLKAEFADPPAPFADPALRGTLMHSALQFLFAAHAGQPGAPGGSDIAPAVDLALKKNRAQQKLLPVSLEAERLRLQKLLAEWLDFESGRSDYSVELREETISADLLGHPILVRADRVDRVGDGGRLVIDYKSSKGSTAGWAQERLRQAQLPLYAVLLARDEQVPVSGIALATVRSGEYRMEGVTADLSSVFDRIYALEQSKNTLTRSFETWQALLAHWQHAIDGLAGEIIAGLAHNVVYDSQILAWSDLQILLRHHEGEAWLLEHGEGHVAER